MLVSYIQNSEVSVSKEVYLEMCEMLGNEPILEEMPVEYEDFPPEVQEALIVYGYLQDRWEGMTGMYLGKDKNGILDVFHLLEVSKQDQPLVFKLINIIDSVRVEQSNKKTNTKPAK